MNHCKSLLMIYNILNRNTNSGYRIVVYFACCFNFTFEFISCFIRFIHLAILDMGQLYV